MTSEGAAITGDGMSWDPTNTRGRQLPPNLPFDNAEDRRRYDELNREAYALLDQAHEMWLAAIDGRRKHA